MSSVFLILVCVIQVSEAFSFSSLFANMGTIQSAGIRGTLYCNGKPASKIKVKLWDEDNGLFSCKSKTVVLGIDTDDLLDSGQTDSNVESILRYTSEFTTIDPKLAIYHDCNDGIKPCQRKFTFYLPKNYVSEGKIPTKIFNMRDLELSGSYENESRDCLNRA